MPIMNASRLPIQVTNRDKGPSPTVNQPETPSLAEITKPKVDLEIKSFSQDSRIPRPGNYKDIYGLWSKRRGYFRDL